jgi:two-component system, cell cycle sensor histidine kinase and response regulator CckA
MNEDASAAAIPGRTLFEAHPEPMWIHDLETLQFLFVNDAAIAQFGYSRDEFLKMTVTELTLEEERSSLLSSTNRAQRQGERLAELWKHQTRNGDVIHVEIISHSLKIGERSCRLVQASDVTAWVEAQAELGHLLDIEVRSRERAELECAKFRALFESAPGLFLVLEPTDYRIIDVSDAYIHATMTSRDEIIGRPLFDVFPDDPADPASDGVRNLRTSLDRVVSTGSRDVMAVQRYPVRRPAAEGGAFEERYWSPINSPVFVDGRLIFIIHRVEDVTEYVRARGASTRSDTGADSPLRAMEADVLNSAREIQQLNRRLEERDRFLVIAGKTARIGGWIAELDSGRVQWSDEVCAIHDAPPGTTVCLEEGLAYYPPEWRPVITQHFADCAHKGTPYDLELEIVSRTGRRVWVRAIGEPVRAADGRIVSVQGAFQDITAWKTARAEFDELSRQMASTLESMSDAFFVLGRDWKFRYVNKTAEATLQRPRHDLLGRNIWDVFPDAVGGRFHMEYHRALETGNSVSFEEYYAPLGAWLAVRAYPSETGLAVYFHDITAHKTAEAALRQQASLLDDARDAILVRSMDHTITFWNKGAERLYGWTAAEAIGQSALALLYGESNPAFADAHDQLLGRGEWTGEIVQRTKRGAEVTVDARFSVVNDDAGQPQRVLCINTDVTEKKKMEAQYLRAQRMESLGTLAGGIAHDLNNTLTPILMSISLLRDEAQDSGVQEILTGMEESAHRAADMVKQVLTFARGMDGARVTVRPERLVASLEKLVRDTFPKNITFKKDIPKKLWAISADPTQCHQVLLNLCVNARDAMPNGGLLRVSVENVHIDAHFAGMVAAASPGRHVRVQVMDTGIGIPADIIGRVFEPFFSTKAVGEGTGLGLSTVDAIVRGHGGFVTVYSEPQKGTTFNVYFPATLDEVEDLDERAQPQLRRGNGQLILVVEDEAAVRTITQQALEGFGYRVVVAVDGADAVALYAQQGKNIDLVITDMQMPIMDGPATIEALKRMNPNARIIAASGLTSYSTMARVAHHQTCGFLPKPYSAAKLLDVVHAALHPSTSDHRHRVEQVEQG